MRNDIAIMELDRDLPVDKNPNVTIAALKDVCDTPDNTTGVVSGWGALSHVSNQKLAPLFWKLRVKIF